MNRPLTVSQTGQDLVNPEITFLHRFDRRVGPEPRTPTNDVDWPAILGNIDQTQKDRTVAWDDLLELFEHPQVIPCKDFDDKASRDFAKRRAGALVAGVFIDDWRSAKDGHNGGRETFSMVGLDIDQDTPDDLEDRLNGLGWRWVAGDSYSSRPGKKRARVLIALDWATVFADDWRALTLYLADQLDVTLDPGSLDMAHIWVLPAVHSQKELDTYWWGHGGTAPVPVQQTLATMPQRFKNQAQREKRHRGAVGEIGQPVPWWWVDDQLSWVETRCSQLLQLAEGQRLPCPNNQEGDGWERSPFKMARDFARLALTPIIEQDGTITPQMSTGDVWDLWEETIPADILDATDSSGAPLREKLDTALSSVEALDPPPFWDRKKLKDLTPGSQLLEEQLQKLDARAKKVAKSSWEDIDLLEIWKGLESSTLEVPKPTVGHLKGASGRSLFYKGATNMVFGDSNSGKTWTALLATVETLQEGREVIYVDYEGTKISMVNRLRVLGLHQRHLKHLHMKRPEDAFTPCARELMAKELEELDPGLVVIDSIGESLALDGKNPNADEEVSLWFRQGFANMAAEFETCAVVIIDHLPKNSDGRFSIGSQRKRSALNGAQYRQEMVNPFSRDEVGYAKLVVTKDREGTAASGTTVAELMVNTAIGGTIELWEPDPAHTTPASDLIPERIKEFLKANPGASKKSLEAASRGTASRSGTSWPR